MKLCPRGPFPYFLEGHADNFYDYASETCMICSTYPLAVVVRDLSTKCRSFDETLQDVLSSHKKSKSGPLCRRNLLRFLIRLFYADAWVHTSASDAFDDALDLDVTPAVTVPEIAGLLSYVRRSVYVSGDAQPVYGDPVSDWTCTVTHVPETCEDFQCMLLQDVVPPLRLLWMTCVARAKK